MVRHLKKKINIKQYLYNSIYIVCRSTAIKRDFF